MELKYVDPDSRQTQIAVSHDVPVVTRNNLNKDWSNQSHHVMLHMLCHIENKNEYHLDAHRPTHDTQIDNI